jgi:hypothetical protein
VDRSPALIHESFPTKSSQEINFYGLTPVPGPSSHDQEALHPGTLISKLPNAINGRQTIDILADRIAAAHVVIPRALLAVDHIQEINSAETIMGHSIPVRDDSTPCFSPT